MVVLSKTIWIERTKKFKIEVLDADKWIQHGTENNDSNWMKWLITKELQRW